MLLSALASSRINSIFFNVPLTKRNLLVA
jgi:hypothetical protein